MRFSILFSALGTLAFLFLLSCSNDKKETDFGIGLHTPNSVIRNHLLFSSFDKDFSFPIWFDDSLIQAKKISHVVRNIFPQSSELERLDSGRVVPAETYHYFFRTDGSVEKVIHFTYFDNKMIGKSTYHYGLLNNLLGFAPTQLDTDFPFDSEIGDSRAKKSKGSKKVILDHVKTEEKYASFKNSSTNERLFLLPDAKYWGPMRVNQKLKPNPEDKIIKGTSYMPLKKYQVKNTIEEFSVEKFTYKKNLIQKIETNKSPFQTKRHFQYDRRGYCISFIDSTNTDGRYLSRTVSQFTNNMDFSPIKIVHKKYNGLGEEAYTFFETFEYEYRK
jgi:hypothetical protein